MTAPKPDPLAALRGVLADVRMGAAARSKVDAALAAVAADLGARDPLATGAAVADVCASAWCLGYAAASRDAADAAQAALSALTSGLRGGAMDARSADHLRRGATPPSPLRDALADAMRDGAATAEDAVARARGGGE